MISRLAKKNLRHEHALPALTIRERADMLRYEDSLGDFVKAAWHHAGEPTELSIKLAHRLYN
jgi:hypothetical protein